MKLLVWLLLLVNVALFGYFRWQATRPGESLAGHEPISAEKLKILTPQELDAMPKKVTETVPAAPAADAAPVHYACYEWGSFSTADVSRARNILDKFNLEATVKQQATQEATRYWVYIPPRKSLEDAQAKMAELKGLGVQESYIVQEPQWRHAISLGVFKDEALANRFLEDLRTRGVRSAVKGARNHESGQAGFFIKNVSAAVAEEIGKLKPDFPGSELKQAACQ